MNTDTLIQLNKCRQSLNWLFITAIVMTIIGVVGGFIIGRQSRDTVTENRQEKPGVQVLYLADPGIIRIRVEPKDDVETTKALEEHIKKFPGAKVQGDSSLP